MHSTMNTVEVITPVERRRRWSREEKQRIVAESARPDRTVSQVARAHGIAANLLFTWRRQFLAAAIGSHGARAIRASSGSVAGESHPALSRRGPPAAASHIKIRLPSGIVINVIGEVASRALRRVLAALAGG